ncbi:TPA: 50S ribosomal protein L21 [bacterium]|nr:50S ribosomal protein L21 [bacterium]
MYAIFEIGKKQYVVREGDIIDIDLLDKPKEEELEFSNVLMIRDDDNLIVDNLDNWRIKAKVLEQKKGPKIVIKKHIEGKGFEKKQGHRQKYTSILITKIEEGALSSVGRASDS